MYQNNTAPLVTIVIPTQKRNIQLKKLLNSIEKSTFKNYEMIIVNDSKEPLIINNNLILKVIKNNSSRGLAYSRNSGAKYASGEYVLFIDDDNQIDKNMIKELIQLIRSNNLIHAVGPITYYNKSKDKLWFAGANYNFYTTKPKFFTVEDFSEKNSISVGIIHNCLMVKRSSGEKVGWFDEFINMGGTEFDLLMKIRKLDTNILFKISKKAICYHDIDLPTKNFFRNLGFNKSQRVYYFQRNRAVFIKKYGNWAHKLLLTCINYPIFLIIYGSIFLYYRKYDYFLAQGRGVFDGYKYLIK